MNFCSASSFAPANAKGVCVYCNRCQPCPAGRNVGLINKYDDLALSGDALARKHYEKLEVKAGNCISCGHCNSRCPFHVDQMERMETIHACIGGCQIHYDLQSWKRCGRI